MNNKTVLRGGAGIFYIPQSLFSGPVEIVQNGLDVPAAAVLAGSQLQTLGIKYPAYNDSVQPLVQASKIISLTAIDPDRKNAYSEQWSLGIQRELNKTMAWEISYVGNHGVKLAYSPTINRVNPGTGTPDRSDFAQFRYYHNGDTSGYHSLQTSLRKRLSKNLLYNINYTYASNMSYWLGDFDCCGDGEGPQNLNDLGSNHGPTPFHIRQRFSSDFLYEAPIGAWLGTQRYRMLLGGWQVAGIFAAQTGTSLAISQGSTNTPGARPDWIGSSHAAAIFNNCTKSLPDGTYWYFDKTFFARAPLGNGSALARPGTLGRRPIYGPGLWNVDLSLTKNLKFGETRRIQLRVDMFNALNHTNFSGVTTDITNSNFGRITSTLDGRALLLSLRLDF